MTSVLLNLILSLFVSETKNGGRIHFDSSAQRSRNIIADQPYRVSTSTSWIIVIIHSGWPNGTSWLSNMFLMQIYCPCMLGYWRRNFNYVDVWSLFSSKIVFVWDEASPSKISQFRTIYCILRDVIQQKTWNANSNNYHEI